VRPARKLGHRQRRCEQAEREERESSSLHLNLLGEIGMDVRRSG